MNSNKNDFYVARENFIAYTSYKKPLSYSEWCNLPYSHKAAVLYIQYFDQVTLAWYKLKSVYSVEADGVDEVLQYLDKNVKKIEADEKRFTPAYIYKVCYNCLYCLCRDPNRYKRVYENECSNIIGYGDDELDLFDTQVDNVDRYEEYNRDAICEAFWQLIEDTDMDTKIVVAKLIGDFVNFDDGGSCYTNDEYQEKLHESWKIEDPVERKKFMNRKAPKGHKLYSECELNSVSADREAEILEKLRQKLAPFRSIFNV